MDKSLKPLLKKLEDSASDLEISLYVVGGGLRNHWLDKPCTDLDFTCRGVTQLARRFAERIRRPCITLDDTPGRETLRVVVHKDSNFDFTELQGKTIEEDLAQRDFTINAMAQPLSGFLAGRTEYHDPHGGRRDLEKRLIRANPGPVLRADPLRLLRAFRFAATLGFEIEADTLAQITRFKEGINRVAVERILHELILFLQAPRMISLLRTMDGTNLLLRILPETGALRRTPLDGSNAWDFSLRAFQRTEEFLSGEAWGRPSPFPLAFSLRQTALLKFAALLHRLDHPQDPVAVRPGKKHCGQLKTATLLERLRFSNDDLRFICRTLYGFRGASQSNLDFAGEATDPSRLFRFVKNHEAELPSALLLACAVRSVAEENLEPVKNSFIDSAKKVYDFYFEHYLPVKNQGALLTGEDLIERFQLNPSPLFRTILERVEEGRVLGTIRSREDAEELARSIIQTH